MKKMKHCNKSKTKCKKIKYHEISSCKLSSKEIKSKTLSSKEIKSKTLSSKEINTNTLFIDDYKIPHPVLQLRGYHQEPSNLVLNNDKFIPFPENGVYEHSVEFNHVLDNFIQGIPEFPEGGPSTFKDLNGWKIDIDYTPTLKNNKNEDIPLKCKMFIELTYVATINTEITNQIINGSQRPPYIDNTEIQFCLNSSDTFQPYKDGLFLNNIALNQGPGLEPKPYISFNETVSIDGIVLKQSTNKLKFDGDINNAFFPKFVSSAQVTGNICNIVGNVYDTTTKRFGVIAPLGPVPIFQSLKNFLRAAIRIDNVIMNLELDNKEDSQFLEVLVGDTGPGNIDHNITLTPVSYPEPA